jgi:ergothioneine biosynthesis protein EgtB
MHLLDDYHRVRRATESLCSPLAVEDYVVQAMPDASPVKWHLAHTTWFFETFLLRARLDGYRSPNAAYHFLFNSYYNSAGPQFLRPDRGHLSRPTVDEVYAYRAHVDKAMETLIQANEDDLAGLVRLGLNHEQQHQELILTDLKYNLGANPLRPAYHSVTASSEPAPPLAFVPCEGGLYDAGHTGDRFAFDNEGPRHRVWLQPYRLGSRLVTCGEYLEFIAAGGYRRWDLWLSEGWRTVRERGWTAPLYWERDGAGWWLFTLAGLQRLDEDAPVSHVSYYEADAYARWRGWRLPTEYEWEVAAARVPIEGHFADAGLYHPRVARPERLAQLFGDCWEWTTSAYLPYPGFRPAPGAVGEYNGKFMINQMVLRGGSCATPADHVRATYRNFFPPDARWQFSGIRLAADA